MRLGLIGCGDVAQRDYLPELHRIADRVELAAVFSRSEERARSIAKDYGIARWYTDVAKLLADSGVEAVANLTPIPVHLDITLAAFAAGKHVYTEKPLASTTADAVRIRDEAAKQGLVLVCAPCSMLFPQVVRAKELLDAGTIGEVHSACGILHGGVPPWKGVVADQSQYFVEGAGPAIDLGVYPLHALTGMLGPVRRVSAFTSKARESFTLIEGPNKGDVVPIQVDDNWHLLLDFGDTRIGTLSANNCSIGTKAPQLELHGLEGTIAVNVLDESQPIDLRQSGKGWEQIDVPHQRSSGPDHILGIEHLEQVVREGGAPLLSANHAIHVIDVIEKAARSSKEGRVFDVDHTTF